MRETRNLLGLPAWVRVPDSPLFNLCKKKKMFFGIAGSARPPEVSFFATLQINALPSIGHTRCDTPRAPSAHHLDWRVNTAKLEPGGIPGWRSAHRRYCLERNTSARLSLSSKRSSLARPQTGGSERATGRMHAGNVRCSD